MGEGSASLTYSNAANGLCLGEGVPGRKVFFFEAKGVEASEVAGAISDYFQCSVLIGGGEGSKRLEGRLQCFTLEEAVESLSFLLGGSYRKLGPGIWLVGGKPERTVRDFPSYGLKGADLGLLLREGGGLVGDRVVLETDQVRAARVGEVLETFARRPSLILEVFILDVAQTKVDRVNAWLDTVKVGAGYFENTAIPATAVLDRVRGFTWQADVQGLLEFVLNEGEIKVELREQVHVMSGGRARFSSGDVVQDVSYTTVPNTTQQLVSNISRRTVGLTLDIAGVCSGTNWVLSFELDDSNLTGDHETTTHYQGERQVHEGEGFFLLGSFTRKSVDFIRKGLPVLSEIRGLRSVFSKTITNTVNRNVMILAKPVSVGVHPERKTASW